MMSTSSANQTERRASTGVAGLDRVLKGGLPEGHLFLVEGEPGTGKTTVGLQFLLAGAARGEKTMYVTLSESRSEIEGVARSHNWSLHGVSIFEYAPTEDTLRSEDQYSAFHPSEVEFLDTTKDILEKVDQLHPARIVFDSLSEIRLLARDSLRYRRQILALKHFFNNRNCTVMLLDDRTAEVHNQLQSIAHGVIMMERLQREYGVERRRIRVAKLRGASFQEGYHDYNIATGGVVVYPRLVAADHRTNGHDGEIESELAELNQLFGGGLIRGTNTLVIGPAGSGKSSLAMSYAVSAARRGERVACFLFDETRESALRRAARLGMDPRDLIEAGLLSVDQVDPAELSPGEFVGRVRDCVDSKNAALIVIDSLNGLLNAMPGESFMAIQMHELLMFLNQRGIVTIMVMAQAGLVGSMLSPADLSYLADSILMLRYFESRGHVSTAISVMKKRSGIHERTIRELRILDGHISVGQPLADHHGILTGVPSFSGLRPRKRKSADGTE